MSCTVRWIAVGLVPLVLASAQAQWDMQQGSFASTVPIWGGFDSNSSTTVGFSSQSGNFFFQQGSAGAAVPPFGGYTPGEGATIGFGFRGSGGSGSIALSAGQGSSRSAVSQSATVTTINGGAGAISSGTWRPFVTGYVPVVGMWQPFEPVEVPTLSSGPLAPARSDDPAFAAPDPRREAAVQRLVQRAEQAERAGQVRKARRYYAIALRQAVGDSRTTIAERIDRLRK